MTASPDLFNLIKSLTPSEKRYFKIFASKHVIGNKNNYEKLFDAFDSLSPDQEYDEAAFKRSLKTKSWVKNFAVEKNLLEELILKALRSYSAEKTDEGKLQSLVTNIRLLFDKGLIDAANKALLKAFELAKEQSNLATLVALYQHKLLLTNMTQMPESIAKSDEDFEADTRVMKLLDIERRSSHIRHKIYNIFNTGKLSVNVNEARKWINEIDALETYMPITTQAKRNNLLSRAMVLANDNRRSDALELFRKVLDLHKDHLVELSQPSRFIRADLANYLNCALFLNQFEEIPIIVERIEELPAETPLEKAETFRIAMHYRLLYCLNTNIKDDCSDLIHDIEKGLKKYRSLIPPRKLVQFRFNICVLYFKQHHYDDVITSINKAYDVIGRDEALKTVVRDLKYLQAAAHISLKNYDLVDYHLRNLERWLREHQLNNDFTALLHKAFRRMMQPSHRENKNGQLDKTNCPPDLLMLVEILNLYWLS